MMSKPDVLDSSGISLQEDGRLCKRHPAYRRHESYLGYSMQLWEPSEGVLSEKAQGATNAKAESSDILRWGGLTRSSDEGL